MVWSANLAYAIGLITTDGCLSKDGRHITLVSKDLDQVQNFSNALNLNNKISTHTSTYNPQGKYYHIQFGNVKLYRFLVKIGLLSNKSMIIKKLNIPQDFFADFFRGCIDGDGNISIVKHPESQFPQVRLRLASASIDFLKWIKFRISHQYKIRGGFISKPHKNVRYLVYAKMDSIKLLNFIYYDGMQYYLKRKFDYYMNLMPK